MNSSGQHRVFSFYRAYLRQVKALPHIYLRIFFRIKGADDFRSVLKTKSTGLCKKKLKRVSKDLQRLRAANRGDSTAFDRVLDIAYGRVGKLRRELMGPLLLDPNAPPLPQTDQREEMAPSPAYSPELATLLTSSISRTTGALQKHHLVSPPGPSSRATSKFEDTVFLGLLSRRREYNIRRRFFNSEWKKVHPPLQVSPQHLPCQFNPLIFSDHPLEFGFHDTVVLQELLALAGSPSRSPDSPSKQRRVQRIQKMSDANPFDGKLSVRWLRRRYQALLGRIPLLISRPLSQDNFKRIYDIQLADNAMTPSRLHPSRLCPVDTKDIPWINDVHLAVQSRRRGR